MIGREPCAESWPRNTSDLDTPTRRVTRKGLTPPPSLFQERRVCWSHAMHDSGRIPNAKALLDGGASLADLYSASLNPAYLGLRVLGTRFFVGLQGLTRRTKVFRLRSSRQAL